VRHPVVPSTPTGAGLGVQYDRRAGQGHVELQHTIIADNSRNANTPNDDVGPVNGASAPNPGG
jgi:hypothetical protein